MRLCSSYIGEENKQTMVMKTAHSVNNYSVHLGRFLQNGSHIDILLYRHSPSILLLINKSHFKNVHRSL